MIISIFSRDKKAMFGVMGLVSSKAGAPGKNLIMNTSEPWSVRRLEDGLKGPILQGWIRQVAAGYIMYGTFVLIVYSVGEGVHSFVLDEEIGEFILDQAEMRIPDRGKLISANFGNRNRWSRPEQAFSDSLITYEIDQYEKAYKKYG